MNKKYFLYSRVSVGGKYDVSLKTQIKILKEIGKEKGITKITTINEVKSGSGKEKRTEFDNMIKTLEEDSKKPLYKREFGGVLFYKLDRLSRNIDDFYSIEKLVKKGYKFISSNESIENTPTGRFLLRILSSLSLYESEKSSNRKKISIIENIFEKQFGKLGGDVHFGYIHKNKKIYVNEVEKQIINRIYSLFLEGKNLEEISTIINDEYKHPKKKGKGYLEGYILDKKFKNPLSLIENIIKNNHFIKYNGVVERKLKINDDLILNHIKYLKNNNISNFDESNIVVGDELNIDVYVYDLSLIGERIYYLVKQKLKIHNDNPPLFGDILFFKDKNGESKVYSGFTKGRYYYSSKKNKKLNISENKIIKIIKEKGLLKSIKNIKNMEIQIIEIFNEVSKDFFSKDIERCRLKQQFYEEEIENLEEKKEKMNKGGEIQQINYIINGYKDLLMDMVNHILELEKNINRLQNNFLSLFSTDNFKKSGDRVLYNLKYEAIFERIVVEGDKIVFYPQLFLKDILGYGRRKAKL